MFIYQKRLQYPIRIANPNPALAKFIISQYGGPNGELGASMRYRSQRFAMPSDEIKGILTDIGTEELGHLEMVGTIIHQLTRNLTPEEIKAFMELAAGGDETIGDRLALFRGRKAALEAQIEELQETLALLSYKCWYYETAQAAGTEDAVRDLPPGRVPAAHRAAMARLEVRRLAEEETGK